MRLIKRLLNLILFMAMLLMGLLCLCAWKPEVTETIAEILYPDRQEEALSLENGAGGGPAGIAGRHNPDAPADLSDRSVRDSGETADSGEEAEEIEAAEDPQAPPFQEAAYIAPNRSDIAAPAQVAGKSGYQEISGNDSQIEEDEAQELAESLSVGETGDGLDFDPAIYPYYSMLDDTGRHLYRQIYANAKALNEDFAPIEPVRAAELHDIFSAVYNDHPELFWVDTAYNCTHRSNGECVEIGLEFNRTASELEKENTVFESAAQEVIAEADGLTGAYDKERSVHDSLVRRIDYVESAEMNQSAYSALVNGRTVCAGYARAFQYIMQKMGIPCYYCTGYSGEDHAWNIILLDDGYYNVDVTWDDTGSGTYDYFNKTDDDYSDTHVRQELSVNLPACNGSAYRTQGPDSGDAGKRSLEEAGFSEDDLLHTMGEYYDDCYAAVLKNGTGSYAYSNVLDGAQLYAQWEQDYETDAYKDEYLIQAMRAVGAKSCHLSLVIEELQQDRYLITHRLVLE